MNRVFATLVIFSLFSCGPEQEKKGTNLVRDAVVIRSARENCDDFRRLGTFDEIRQQGNEGCMSDEECIEGDNGRCRWIRHSESNRTCTYDVCSKDDDCSSSEVCSCGDDSSEDFYIRSDANSCVNSNCATSADCGQNKCKANLPCGNGRINGYFCATDTDTCSSDMDCDAGLYCIYKTGANQWNCGKQC